VHQFGFIYKISIRLITAHLRS